jgi:hypothetical protein
VTPAENQDERVRLCPCHRKPMYARAGRYRCWVKLRQTWRRYSQSERGRTGRAGINARRLFCGSSYHGLAPSVEAAARINVHVAQKLTEFLAHQARKREAWRANETPTDADRQSLAHIELMLGGDNAELRALLTPRL